MSDIEPMFTARNSKPVKPVKEGNLDIKNASVNTLLWRFGYGIANAQRLIEAEASTEIERRLNERDELKARVAELEAEENK